MVNLLGGFGQTVIGVTLGSETLQEIGQHFTGPFADATSSFVSIGVLQNTRDAFSSTLGRVSDFFRG